MSEIHTGLTLVAVSGGSDSLALLYRLKDQGVAAATVDHGLRPEAKAEAEHVARICAKLNIPHTILAWDPTGKSAQAARTARYDLLVAHAKTIGAQTIALGHTMDDQTETLVMRALRSKPKSGTRGLSGMCEWSTHKGINLHRPLLNVGRVALQDELRTLNVEWINDPSNEKLTSERVRVRKALASSDSFLTSESIGKLASLSAATRGWLNAKTAEIIEHHVSFQNDFWHLQPTARALPRTLLIDVFSTLILATGTMPFRAPIAKFEDLVSAFQNEKPLRKAVARCLVNVRKDGAHFSVEDRAGANVPGVFAMEHFRPSIDDVLFSAITQRRIKAQQKLS